MVAQNFVGICSQGASLRIREICDFFIPYVSFPFLSFPNLFLFLFVVAYSLSREFVHCLLADDNYIRQCANTNQSRRSATKQLQTTTFNSLASSTDFGSQEFADSVRIGCFET